MTEALYFSLWFMVTLASLWDMRRTHRFMQASLEHIEQTAQEIARLLGRRPE
jgi:hypothetical protein